MRNRGRLRLICLASLMLGMVLAGGCKKQRSSLNLKKLGDIVNEATSLEATKYKEPQFNDVKAKMEQAQQAYAGKNYSSAFDISRGALTNAQTMLKEVKESRAADLQNQAEEDRKIAESNQGQLKDPARYQSILDSLEKGKTRYSKSDMDGAIEHFNEVIQGVATLLAPMRQEAEDRLARVESAAEGMEAEGVRQHAIPQGLAVDKNLKTAQELIRDKRLYQTGQTVLSETEQSIAQAIEKAKEIRSNILINEIETDLMVAWNKGADIHFSERLKSAAEAYENVLRDFSARNFDLCLQAADLLKPKVQQLKYDTRKKSAETKIASLEALIKNLDEGGAREYLPGKVEILEEMLKDAKGQVSLLTEPAFDKAEEICQAANLEHDRIQSDFNDLSTRAIADANKEMEIATKVFEATETIFEVPSPGQMTSLEKQLETNKQAMRQEIGALLKAARKSLETSQLKRDNQRYRDAILDAEDVKKTAQVIQQETYRVVAHNSILEVQAKITYYDTQGGRQYAAEAVDEASSRIRDARDTLERGDAKAAVDKAALAKAQLDILKQELSAKGGQGLVKAEEAIRSALDEGALEKASERIEQARSNLERALAARDTFNYKEMIEKSANAAALARGAELYAEQMHAKAALAGAQTAIERAEKSDAGIYAPRPLKDARDLHAGALDKVKAEDYEAAAEMAKSATQTADEAAFERAILAEKEIATAQRYNAWTYSSRRLADAINAAKEAQRQADAGDFDTSRGYADRAILLAQQATAEAKSTEVTSRIAALQEGVQEGLGKGAGLFQAQNVKEIMDRMAVLAANYHQENHDAAAAELRELEARLEETLISTPAVLERTLAQQNSRRERFIEEGPYAIRTYVGEELNDSEKALRYSKIDFEKGEYRNSYANLRKAIALLDEVEDVIRTSKYNEEVGRIFADFVAAQDDFRSVLTISETAMIQLATNTADGKAQAVSIAGGKPIQFREKIEDLYKRAEAVEPPPSKKTIHESVVRAFLTAQRAAQNFEKLVILDQYDKKTAGAIIRAAFEQLKAAREQQQAIEATFREPHSDSVIVRTRKALGVELY